MEPGYIQRKGQGGKNKCLLSEAVDFLKNVTLLQQEQTYISISGVSDTVLNGGDRVLNKTIKISPPERLGSILSSPPPLSPYLCMCA